jgi:hypothetical protein
MAFCIDVRSAVFRRALESLDGSIRTLGFAGFYGLGVGHRRFGSDVVETRLPALLAPQLFTCAGAESAPAAVDARITARGHRAWGRFKLAAISSFAFVEASGPLYALKLARDALGLAAPEPPPEPAPVFAPRLDDARKAQAAEAALRAMSLTQGFARLVVLAGHGAGVVNNPHASALQCGACGGYAGDVNARLLAGALNDARVREALRARGARETGRRCAQNGGWRGVRPSSPRRVRALPGSISAAASFSTITHGAATRASACWS